MNEIAKVTDAVTFDEYFTLEVTTFCDAHCLYCFALAQVKPLHMELEQARQIADEAYRSGYRYFHITGGEPLLWPHWLTFVEYLNKIGYLLILTNTGARRLSPKNLKFIRGNPEKIRFTVTLNGPNEIHRITRGDNFEQVTANIKRLIHLGSNVTIFTVATKPLIPVLGKFLQYVYETFPEIDCLKLIQLHRPAGDEHDLSQLILNEDEFIEMVRITGLYAVLGKHIEFLDNPLTTVAAKALGIKTFASPPLLRRGRLSIQANGAITGAHSNRTTIGAYRPGVLQELAQQDSAWTKLDQPDPACLQCRFHQYCREAQMMRPSEPHRDYHEETPFCVRVNQKLIEYRK